MYPINFEPVFRLPEIRYEWFASEENQLMYEGRIEGYEHIYPTMKRRYTYKNKGCQ
jgi:hypothetical protein